MRRGGGLSAGTSLLRLVRTLRWLRAPQLWGQVRLRIRGAFERPERWPHAAPEVPELRWRAPRDFLPPGSQENCAEEMRSGRFRFLQRSETLGWPPRWAQRDMPRLWDYNLHYFEYLWALPFEDGRRLVLDWIERHPLGRGRTGWEPYPISLRSVNWCGYFLGRHRAETQADGEFQRVLWSSLHRQLAWLSKHLESHLLGNHLFENAAALAFCGSCFAGDAAARWLREGLALLGRELPEQVLRDGGHFERSPMYHARITYLLQLLEATGVEQVGSRVAEPLLRMRAALAHFCHPDGDIALLNDSALGISNPPSDLVIPEAPSDSFALPDTGYYGARSSQGHYLICDAAPVGPDYQPGHAHADLLAFELSLASRRVIVDAGVFDYEPGPRRDYCRSTAAHNTVEVEGQDQCEFWGAFRVARRAHPREVEWQELAGGGFRLQAAHDGYRRLPGRPLHRRLFRWHGVGLLLVRDRVEASSEISIRSRLHLHPDCEVVELGVSSLRVTQPGGEFRVHFAGPGRLEVERWRYCPRFGVEREGRVLIWSLRGRDVEFGFCVSEGDSHLGFDLSLGAERDGVGFAF